MYSISRAEYIADGYSGDEVNNLVNQDMMGVNEGNISDTAIDAMAKVSKARSIKSGKGQQAYSQLMNDPRKSKQLKAYNEKAKANSQSRYENAMREMSE